MLLAQDIIKKARSGEKSTYDELKTFFDDFLAGKIADYQVSAWLMAVVLKGLSREETSFLTKIMRDSGHVFEWNYPKNLIVDKHSTGGVGDKTSLIILPLCILEGLKMPMMAGRGLGHTGGTLDKLAAVGWNVFCEPAVIQKTVDELGGIFMGQTEQVVPLDRRLYALRDVTATVESTPLLTASILSKKLAEGLGNLVMDVKCGSGAFLPDPADARNLAEEIIAVGSACGLKISCFITDMGSPLGRFAGNALEVYECIQVMQGGGPQKTRELSLALATEAVLMSDPKRSEAEIRARLARHLDSGAALEVFKKLAKVQGADMKLLDAPESLIKAKYVIPVFATPNSDLNISDDVPRSIQSIDVRALGMAMIHLGGGRQVITDTIDPWVGLSDLRHVGDVINEDEPIAFVHANHKGLGDKAAAMVQKAYSLTHSQVTAPPLIFDVIKRG